MKLTKTKVVVTEEIELQEGVYFYKDNDNVFYKTSVKNIEDGFIEYSHELVELFYDVVAIRVKKDEAFFEDELPYKFSAFLRGIGGEKITEEEFNKQKQEVLSKLT